MNATKKLIHQAIDKFDDTDLNEIYLLIQNFVLETPQQKRQSLLSKLRLIQIEGPEDFATNSDAYILGEKHA